MNFCYGRHTPVIPGSLSKAMAVLQSRVTEHSQTHIKRRHQVLRRMYRAVGNDIWDQLWRR